VQIDGVDGRMYIFIANRDETTDQNVRICRRMCSMVTDYWPIHPSTVGWSRWRGGCPGVELGEDGVGEVYWRCVGYVSPLRMDSIGGIWLTEWEDRLHIGGRMGRTVTDGWDNGRIPHTIPPYRPHPEGVHLVEDGVGEVYWVCESVKDGLHRW
jgi:hypothetical protein